MLNTKFWGRNIFPGKEISSTQSSSANKLSYVFSISPIYYIYLLTDILTLMLWEKNMYSEEKMSREERGGERYSKML